MERVTVESLKLGDVIRISGFEPYGDATVRQIHKDGRVSCFRVYVHADDVEYTNGIICYIGTEDFDLYPKHTVELLKKGKPTR